MSNELQSILDNEYGIQVFREDIAKEDLERRGYRKATKEEAERFNTIFQYAPHIAKDVYYADAVQKTFENAVKESYRVKIEPGLHLGKSHTIKGAFKGNAYDESGKLRTHADWLLNDAELNVSVAPQIAMSVFNATSFVTGQYFMAEINRSLSDIRTDIKEIKQFLENEKESEMKAIIDDLNEIISHLPFIFDNPDRIRQELQKLSIIQSLAKKNIYFSKGALSGVKQDARDNDKGDVIKKRLKDAVDVLVQYRLMVCVFCQSKLIELYLNNVFDIKELTLYRDELNSVVNDYMKTYSSTIEWMHSYLNENHSLNDIGALQLFATTAVGLSPILLKGWRGIGSGIKSAQSVSEIMNSKRKDNKNDHIGYAKKLIDLISDDRGIKEPVRNLTKYIEATRRKIEIIKIEENVYTNLPA